MTFRVDARVPVRFAAAADAAADEAVLVEGADFVADAPGHAAGCACCVARSGAARALARLFQARARGEVGFFRRVVLVTGGDGEAAVRRALAEDPLVAAWFRC